MKKYPAEATRNLPTSYGVEVKINFPEAPEPVLIAQDIFGEIEPLCQILIYTTDKREEEPAISIRFNDDGTIAEISLPKKYRALVVEAEAPTATPWMIRRDGV